jgi:integrase/recombinase XerC
MPYVAKATITCSKGGALSAACATAGFYQRGAYPTWRLGRVRFKLAHYVAATAKKVPSLASKNVTSHSFRHATAVHLGRGVDITVIRSWLMHVSLDTTIHYAQANLKTKRKALERVALHSTAGKLPRWRDDRSVLE